jgi:hypothetical protein
MQSRLGFRSKRGYLGEVLHVAGKRYNSSSKILTASPKINFVRSCLGNGIVIFNFDQVSISQNKVDHEFSCLNVFCVLGSQKDISKNGDNSCILFYVNL